MNTELRPPHLRPPSAEEHKPSANTRHRKHLVWGVGAVLLLLALIVLIVLPKQVNRPETTAEPNTETATTRDTVAVTTVTKPLAQQDAELALQAFLRLRAQPDLQAAETWAPGQFNLAIDLAEAGDAHYGHGRFNEARDAYTSAAQALLELQEKRPDILRETLSTASDLLQNNQVSDAIQHFERALVMQPEHPQATTGLARSQVREQVLEQMATGREAESTNMQEVAAEAYRAALALDPDYVAASLALQRMTEQLDQQAYQAALSRALNAIDAGNFSSAQTALNAATGLRPGAPELQDAEQRLQAARKKKKLRDLRHQAETLAGNEQWSSSADLYQAALKLDSRALFASSGLTHARSRIKLHTQLDHFLDNPQRLASEAPLSNAQILLAANPSPPEGEPVLSKKVSALKQAVTLYSSPVDVRLESDNLTQVSIYHVGRLGAFTQKALKLRPGSYTVTGSRVGYRDVRRQITLEPGVSATISIRCEEPI